MPSKISHTMFKYAISTILVGSCSILNLSCKHSTDSDSKGSTQNNTGDEIKASVANHSQNTKDWFAKDQKYSKIVSWDDFNAVNEAMRKLGIHYLYAHNKLVNSAQATAKDALANAIYNERVDACMLNPAGKDNSTAKRWFYCQFPLELRLCNTVVLLMTKKEVPQDRLTKRLLHYNTCLYDVDFQPYGRYSAAFNDASFMKSVELSIPSPNNATSSKKLVGAAAIKYLYENIYLNDDIKLGTGENSELQEQDSAKNPNRWVTIIRRGDTANMKLPDDFAPRLLAEHAVYWLKKFKYLNPTFKALSNPVDFDELL